MKSVATLLAVSFILWSSSYVTAASNTKDVSFGGGVPPRAKATFTTHAPTVDGIWNEREWDETKSIIFPNHGDPSSIKNRSLCEVRFLWTKAGVYFVFRATELTPVYGEFKPGEPIYQGDAFELFIDQVGDQRQYYEIQMDPAAQVFIKNYVLSAPPRLTSELRLSQEFVESDFWRYDLPTPEGFRIASQLDSKTHVWTLEAFLPNAFINRRGGSGPMKPCTWRMNLVRHDWDLSKNDPKRQVKFMYWAPVLDGHPHLSPRAMGWLEFVRP